MQFLLDFIISITSLTIVGSYAWSLRGHFNSPKMEAGAKLITVGVIATTAFFLYLVWSGTQMLWVQGVGLGFEIGSAGLFWWAVSASRQARLRFVFTLDHPDSLVTDGPYRYLRHPFLHVLPALLVGVGAGILVDMVDPAGLIFYGCLRDCSPQ